MIDEYSHRWDRPEPDHVPNRHSVVTTPEQALTGAPVGLANLRAICIACRQAHHEGEQLRVYAYRTAEGPALVLTRCFCVECTEPEIETPTLGTSEVLER